MTAIVSAEVECGLVMAVQDFLARMLTGELIEVAVDGFRMATFRFELDRDMLDAKFGGDPSPDRLKQIAGQRLVVPVDLDMRRQHDEPRLDGPNV